MYTYSRVSELIIMVMMLLILINNIIVEIRANIDLGHNGLCACYKKRYLAVLTFKPISPAQSTCN